MAHDALFNQRVGPVFLLLLEYAIRLESVCHVIKKVLNLTFKPEEIRRAVEECEFASFRAARASTT